jgi:soluble lytic murein transglycosylase
VRVQACLGGIATLLMVLGVEMDALAAVDPAEETPTSYFDDGPFRAVRLLVDRGEARRAVQLLRQQLREHPDGSNRAQARYLLGLCLLETGDNEEAARLFGELSVSYPELRDDHAYYQGLALYRWGNFLDAARTLTRVDAEGPRGRAAVRLRARALRQASDFRTLVRWLGEMDELQALSDPELLAILAEARHRTGDVLGAIRAYRRVWRETSKPNLAADAVVRMAELRIGDRELLSVADRAAVQRFRDQLLSEKSALTGLIALDRHLSGGHGSKKLRAEILFFRARYAERAGRLSQAQRLYVDALKLAPAELTGLRGTLSLELGKLQERQGQVRAAFASYKEVIDRFGEQPQAEDALFLSGELALKYQRYPLARERFQALLLRNPVSIHRRRVLWSLGWVRYRLGDYERAEELFRSLVQMGLSPELDGASRYWLGRTLEARSKQEEAQRVFRALLAAYPLTYYAALAQNQLQESGQVGSGARGKRPEAEREVQTKDEAAVELTQVEEYIRLGLRRRALTALRAFEEASSEPGPRVSEAALRSMARHYDALGRSADARRVRERIARAYPHTLGSKRFVEAAKMTHPLRFSESIEKASREFGVSKHLLYALIRTESAFRLDAVSPAEAYGLAQLILPTAREVSKRIKGGPVTRERLLTNPDFNVRLGAAYLQTLLERYAGSEPLALAAYNAGPYAVDSWIHRRVRNVAGLPDQIKGVGLKPQPDELAEEIPVEETRKYVKTVIARARGYMELYAQREQTPEPRNLAGVAKTADQEPTWPTQRAKRRPKTLRGGIKVWTSDSGWDSTPLLGSELGAGRMFAPAY